MGTVAAHLLSSPIAIPRPEVAHLLQQHLPGAGSRLCAPKPSPKNPPHLRGAGLRAEHTPRGSAPVPALQAEALRLSPGRAGPGGAEPSRAELGGSRGQRQQQQQHAGGTLQGPLLGESGFGMGKGGELVLRCAAGTQPCRTGRRCAGAGGAGAGFWHKERRSLWPLRQARLITR